MTVSTFFSRTFQSARPAIRRPIARILAAMIVLVSTAVAGPALAVNKTVNSITLDINMPQAQRGVPYSFQLTPSGRTAPYTFTILSGALPAAFTMSSSGLVTGVNCVSSNGSYNVAVRVTSADGNSADFTSNQSVSINMTAGPASGCALTGGAVTSSGSSPKVGEYYSATISASGGVAPYTYTVATGALPTGLSLSSSGTISGTPSAAGSFDFQVQSSDSAGNTGYTQYTMSVAVADTVVVSPSSLPTPVLTQAYSQTVSGSGGTSPYTFAVSSGSLPTGLSLAASTGVISGTPTAAGAYSFTIRATDAGSQTGTRSYSGTIAAALAITTNTLPTPVLTQAYSQTVATSGGTAPIAFSISAGSLPTGLSLNTSTGAITGTPTAAGAYSFTVRALDANSIAATKAYTSTIAAALAITTATLPTPVLTQAYSQTVATSGGTAPVTFSVSAGSLPTGLSLNTSTGAIAGTPTAAGAYSFTIQASDANSITTTQDYGGTIAAALAITTNTLPTPVLTQAYSQTVATSGGTAPVAFSISVGTLPTGLSLNTSTGAITGTPTAAGAYSFTVRALDANSIAATKAYTGTIAAALSITTATLPTPVLTQAYSQTVATSGGTAPVTFSVSAGSLPTGLNLNTSTGAITGTPTASGAYSFTIEASDANSITATQSYSGTISSGLAITTMSLPTPVLTQAYSQTVSTTNGTAPVTFSVSAGSLPTGLNLNTSTGAITGTPTASGAYSFTIQASDAASATATQTYSGTIAGGLSITTATLPTPVLSQAYSQTVATSGGTAPIAFSVSVGSLPTGLSLNTFTGAITGTPTASGAYSFTIQASDANSTTATQAYSGSIAGGLSITTASLPTPVLTQAYSQTVASSGGTAPVTFSVSAGSLPTGLNLNTSTGAITGTPTASGAYSFTIQASDAASATATQTYSGTIAGGLSITMASLPTPVLTQAYSQTVATSGGTAPIAFSVSAGSLPTGLSLNTSTGAITGTPTAAGAYSFTIQASDANSIAATQAYSGAIAAALSITTATLPTPVLTQAYSQTVATSGGTAPVAFSISAGSLPTGLSLNTSTGAITGTPTAAGAYSFTIQASDANSITANRAYSGTISSGLAITTMTLPVPVLTQAYGQTVASTGGTAPVSFSVSSGALPAGLTLDTTTGAISGAATTGGAYSFTVRAVDTNNVAATQSYSGVIAAAPVITTTSLPAPVLGRAYQATVVSTGGSAPVTFALSAGALPTGLALNTSTGLISGQPNIPGAYSFTIQARDVHDLTDSRPYSGSIATALSITTASVSAPVLGQPYAQSISTTGGSAPVRFAVSGGALPAGLSLNAVTGAISGTPTTAGAFSFTIEAQDNEGVTATQTYSGAIAAALSITTTSLAEPAVNEPYSQAIATNGGVAPVTFSITSGALPAGLSLDSSGAISGTPTATGGFSFTVQARDANGVVASQSLGGEIATPLSVGASDLGTLTVGQTYSTPVNISGGKGSYAFNISAGALPPGMTMNASGLISGAPTTVGAYSAAVQVTDARGARATGTVTATVVAAVTADDQSVEVLFNTAKTITLATLASGDKVEVQAQPAHGQLTPAGGNVEYAPTQDYIGADTFTFIVKGAWGQSRLATVKLNVLPPPPPTAEPPPTKTIDTTETGANGGAAVVVDKIDFNLANLVKGIVTDVQIATYPQHGKVELIRSSTIAACGTGGRQCGQSAALAAPAITAVYTADKGYVGPDSFTFVAIGPGGVSAPARVNIEVVKTVPTAPVLKATAEGGRKATVDLTANATDGPFLAAALVTTPATSIGTTRLIEGGTATAHTYALEFTSKGAFTGDLTFTYTLTNSTGVSAPLTVILTVKARPDPTNDASVRGVSDAQTEAARRFAGTQMDNFGRRLESLHGNQKGTGFGLSVGSAVGSADDCRLRAHTPEEERACRERAVSNGGEPSTSPGERRIGDVEVWTGGTVTVGRRDADTRLAKLTVQTSGVSGGADVRLTPAFTLGLGGGYASDATKLSGGKGRVDADGWTAATYASLHPRSGVFVDAVAGVGDLNFDTRRTIAATGASVTGRRNASLGFGSVTAGFDGTAKAASWSLYLRAKALDATLGAYAEQGSTDTLAYDKRRLNSLIGVIGGRIQLDRAIGEVRLTPRVRIEFSHEFAAVDPQRIRYADWMDGASYQLMGDAWASDRVTLGVGSGMAFDNGWSLDLDLDAELAKHQSSATARVGAAKRF